MEWRLLKLGEVDACTSNALIEALGMAKSRGIIGNTLALCRPPIFVWLGRETSLSQVNVPFCKDREIPISRCIMDGGVALYGGQPLYAFVADRTFPPSSLIECIVNACQTLGLSAKIRPHSNDILVEGRKIAGTGIRVFNNALLFTGNIVLDFDYDLSKKTLIVPPEKFMDKTAKSVEEWVTTAKTELGREIRFDEVEDALKKGFEEVLQVKFDVVDSLSEAEEQILKSLQEKYQSDEWMKYGRWSPVKDYER